jgi:hypothetical protein
MTKLFRDVDYYITEASNNTQKQFELDFVDVIEVYDTTTTKLITEDGKELIIYWYSNGYYQSYQVIEKPITHLMSQSSYIESQVKDIIKTLKYLTYNGQSVDGETMQYILEKIGMEDQMLKQLIMSQPIGEVEYMFEERKQFEEFNKK